MGRGRKKRRGWGRQRRLGNVARSPSGKVKPTKSSAVAGGGSSVVSKPAKPTNYQSSWEKAFKRQQRREKKRGIEQRMAEERARKTGATREDFKAKADAERAKARAERQARR